MQDQTVTAGLGSDDFKAAFRDHPAGTAVITADSGTGPVGLTATSVFSVSVEPPTIVFSLSDISSSTPAIRAAETVVVHLLGVEDLWLAKLCSTSGIDRFADTTLWTRLPTGEPYFPTASRWIRGEVVSRTPVGTATMIAVRALESGVRPSDDDTTTPAPPTPLVYHNRTWHALGSHSEVRN